MDATPARRSMWHFTLRELLLGTAAVASILALALKYQEELTPFSESRFFVGLEPGSATFKPIFLKAGASQLIKPTGGYLRPGHFAATYTLTCPKSKLNTVAAELRDSFQELLIASGCKTIDKREWFDATGVNSFAMSYESGSTAGTVYAYAFPPNDDELLVHVFVHEHKR